jgi:hypothetical protein
VKERGVRFWEEATFDHELEENLGEANNLLETRFSKEHEEIINNNLGTITGRLVDRSLSQLVSDGLVLLLYDNPLGQCILVSLSEILRVKSKNM